MKHRATSLCCHDSSKGSLAAPVFLLLASLQGVWTLRLSEEEGLEASHGSHLEFDCGDAATAAEQDFGWSELKQAWCCQERGIGCKEQLSRDAGRNAGGETAAGAAGSDESAGPRAISNVHGLVENGEGLSDSDSDYADGLVLLGRTSGALPDRAGYAVADGRPGYAVAAGRGYAVAAERRGGLDWAEPGDSRFETALDDYAIDDTYTGLPEDTFDYGDEAVKIRVADAPVRDRAVGVATFRDLGPDLLPARRLDYRGGGVALERAVRVLEDGGDYDIDVLPPRAAFPVPEPDPIVVQVHSEPVLCPTPHPTPAPTAAPTTSPTTSPTKSPTPAPTVSVRGIAEAVVRRLAEEAPPAYLGMWSYDYWDYGALVPAEPGIVRTATATVERPLPLGPGPLDAPGLRPLEAGAGLAKKGFGDPQASPDMLTKMLTQADAGPMGTSGRDFPLAPYDCQAGLHDGVFGWSTEKRIWCCEHAGTGCIERQPGIAQGGTSQAAAPYAAPLAAAPGMAVAPAMQPYGYATDAMGLAAAAPSVMVAAPAAFAPAPVPANVLLAPAPVVVAERFNCTAGLANGMEGWSAAKKAWCEANGFKLLPAAAPAAPVVATAAAVPAPVQQGTMHSETHEEVTYGPQRPVVPLAYGDYDVFLAGAYDYGGYSDYFFEEWWVSPTTTTTTTSTTTTTCSSNSCLEGLKDGIEAWSPQKREYCCRVLDLGCDLRPRESPKFTQVVVEQREAPPPPQPIIYEPPLPPPPVVYQPPPPPPPQKVVHEHHYDPPPPPVFIPPPPPRRPFRPTYVHNSYHQHYNRRRDYDEDQDDADDDDNDLDEDERDADEDPLRATLQTPVPTSGKVLGIFSSLSEEQEEEVTEHHHGRNSAEQSHRQADRERGEGRDRGSGQSSRSQSGRTDRSSKRSSRSRDDSLMEEREQQGGRDQQKDRRHGHSQGNHDRIDADDRHTQRSEGRSDRRLDDRHRH
eukprot:TRINITY_DN26488_c0_g1_i1.p1 TRINITY_DN26488_c0_g1~~TRINITY_DN26488_c0_g1_i1.p1  ORF type:complete len:969 (-),score=183.48 TRINITY_DN26488_c0_g1_i1:157-3063(-)